MDYEERRQLEVNINADPSWAADRIAELEAALREWREGFKGSCYACEPVGEQNIALRSRIAELEAENRRLLKQNEVLAAAACSLDLALQSMREGK